MNTKNVDLIRELVSTKYGDFKGYISVDNRDMLGVFDMCKENGIDEEKYFLFGFGFMEETTIGVGQHGNVICNVLLLEKEKYGDNYEDIAFNIQKLDVVDVVKKHFHVKYTDLHKYIKRYSFMTVTEMSNNISAINLID